MAEIFYIGGSPCSGKSTVAEMLAKKYGFQYFKQDDYLETYIDRGVQEGHELFRKISHMSMEEMWMRPPAVLCAEEIALYEVMFSYSVNDISALPKGYAIIAEGAGFMPDLVKRINVDKLHYICIVPTKEFQVRMYTKREWISEYLSDCSNQNKAFENWMERDALFAETVLREAKDLGYASLVVDGLKSIEANFAAVEGVFQLYNTVQV